MPTCPKCGRPMIVRNGRNGKFMGCTGYPECKNTRNLKPGEDAQTPDEKAQAIIAKTDGLEWLGKINALLEEALSIGAFTYWKYLNSSLPDVWNKPASSSLKYHRKGGYVHTIAQHTFEMLYTTLHLLKVFGGGPKSDVGDLLLLAVATHDMLKYGETGEREHTTKDHDKAMADFIATTKERIPLDVDGERLAEIVRYHSGVWSTDFGPDLTLKALPLEAIFVHIVDVLSAKGLIDLSH